MSELLDAVVATVPATSPLREAFTGVALACLGAVAVAIATVTPYIPRIMRAIFDRMVAQIEGQRVSTLKTAGETAVAAVEEDAKHIGTRGEDKRTAAIAMVQSMAPVAAAAAPRGAIENVVAAGVAKMRASLPSPDALHTAIPVTVVSSSVPPPPAPLPSFPLDEPLTGRRRTP